MAILPSFYKTEPLPSTNLHHCLEEYTGFHSRTREILDDEGEYGSFNNSIFSIRLIEISYERIFKNLKLPIFVKTKSLNFKN